VGVHFKLVRRLACIRLVLPPLAAACLFGGCVSLQCQQPEKPQAKQLTLASEQSAKLVCPGGFPTDLTITNCAFTPKQRLQQWVTVSFTDEAMLGAVGYGAWAQIIKSPGEWGRTWGGYGDHIGVRYTQGAARGTAEYLVGSFLHDDPRHLSYINDPHTKYGDKVTSCSIGDFSVTSYPVTKVPLAKRIGHAFLDSVTVLESNPCGSGRRIPAIDRYVGIAAGAYGGYAWYPGPENTLSNAGLRAAQGYGSTLLGSFYTEFTPEISLGLSKLFGQKKTP
jgi:hypothetical protein